MRTATLVKFLVILYVVGGGGGAFGDGKIFVWRNKEVDIFQPAQKGVIFWDGKEEKLILQTRYEGPAEDLVWVVPVPSEPKVERGNPKIFEDYSKRTQAADIWHTRFVEFETKGRALGEQSESLLKWRRRIGSYDVALLSPVGETEVVEWLNSNEYGVEEDAAAILRDYVKRKWWMVAARIHRDALKEVTRQELAKGTLHPLEIVFATSDCVYPLRVTSLAAGPVEVLLYIEAEKHVEPVTLTGGGWEIDLYGGPLLELMDNEYLESLEASHKIRTYRYGALSEKRVTKLRRVFKPEEMTDDIVFGPMDYGKFISNAEPEGIAEAATQYGRSRDAGAIPHLVKILDVGELSDEVHVRSCIWALGEAALNSRDDVAVKKVLLKYAEDERLFVRMEAYVAIAKLDPLDLAKVVSGRMKEIFGARGGRFRANQAELEILGPWLDGFAAGRIKDDCVRTISDILAEAESGDLGDYLQWAVKRAAFFEDRRLIKPLSELRGKGRWGSYETSMLLAAEAACGCEEAFAESVKRIVDKQEELLKKGQGEGGWWQLTPLNRWGRRDSLRTRLLRGNDKDFGGFTDTDPRQRRQRETERLVPASVQDRVFRTAVSDEALRDWYVLYLVSWISSPNAGDKASLYNIWDSSSGPGPDDIGKRLMVTDVLYSWADKGGLLELCKKCRNSPVCSEIVWALAELGVPEAAPYVEKEIREKWNPAFAAVDACITYADRWVVGRTDPVVLGEPGKAKSLWCYLHPGYSSGGGCEEGTAVLKRICSDTNLHPGLRFFLLSWSGQKDGWVAPLLERAAADILAGEVSPKVFDKVIGVMGYAQATDFLSGLWSEQAPAQRQRNIIGSLLRAQNRRGLATIRKAYKETWLRLYVASEGKAEIFSQPGTLQDRVHRYAEKVPEISEVLLEIIQDASVPVGYRAFVACEAPADKKDVLVPLMEGLLSGDIPEPVTRRLEESVEDYRGDSRQK